MLDAFDAFDASDAFDDWDELYDLKNGFHFVFICNSNYLKMCYNSPDAEYA